MIVRKSRLLLDENEARIAATVLSEAGHFPPFELVIGVPRAYVGWLDLTGNPFVPTFLLLANVLGENLRLDGTVSPQLLSNASKTCALFRSWWRTASVSVEAEALAPQRPPGTGCALFFTRGVDSWHSALRNRTEEQPGPVTHLLYAADFDRQYSPATRRRALRLTREAAHCLGLPLVPISHNGRDLVDRFLNWEFAHGGVVAGIGLALGGCFTDVLRASCIDSGHLIPWGSHPELDSLWSTERTTFHLDGVETTRTNKVRSIASSEVALTRLKVCWREDIDANCGRCDKCLRTQCALAIAGALDRAPCFSSPLRRGRSWSFPLSAGSTRRVGRKCCGERCVRAFRTIRGLPSCDPRPSDVCRPGIRSRLHARNPMLIRSQLKHGPEPRCLSCRPRPATCCRWQ